MKKIIATVNNKTVEELKQQLMILANELAEINLHI